MVEIGIEDARLRTAQAMAREAFGEGVLAHRRTGQAGLAVDAPERLPVRAAATDIFVEPLPSADRSSPCERLGGSPRISLGAPDRRERYPKRRQLL